MIRATAFTSVLASVLAATYTHAADQPNCSNPVTQLAMNVCAVQDFQRADAALNEVYRRVRAAMAMRETTDPSQKDALAIMVGGQRGWITYRDGHCDTVGLEAAGGSMQPLLVYACKAALTETRTRELEALIENK